MEALFPVLIPIALTAVAFIFFKLALRHPGTVGWRLLGLGILIVVLVCTYVGWFASNGSWGPIVGAYFVLILSGTSLVFGVALAMTLPGRHKLFAGFVILVLPLALFLSLRLGDTDSPEATTQANGNLIVQALNQYYLDHHTYPKTLAALMPNYLTDLRTPASVWGWLYLSTDHDYSLGFVTWVDSWTGYSTCLYTSNSATWQYLDSSGPFKLGPTPGPLTATRLP